MWSGVEWMGEWSGVDTPQTVMTTRAPAVLIKDLKISGDFAVGNDISYSYFCTSRNPGRMQSFTKSNIVAS